MRRLKLLIILGLILMVGCSSSKTLQGCWERENLGTIEQMVFQDQDAKMILRNENGSLIHELNATFTTEKDIMSMIIKTPGGIQTPTFKYTFEGDNLDFMPNDGREQVATFMRCK